MAGLKKNFPLWPKQHDHRWFSYGSNWFTCTAFTMPKNAVNKIPSKGKIHPPIAKMKPLKILFHRSGGRQTVVVLQQIEKCGSLPRSRYTGFGEVSEHKKAAEHFRGFVIVSATNPDIRCRGECANESSRLPSPRFGTADRRDATPMFGLFYFVSRKNRFPVGGLMVMLFVPLLVMMV